MFFTVIGKTQTMTGPLSNDKCFVNLLPGVIPSPDSNGVMPAIAGAAIVLEVNSAEFAALEIRGQAYVSVSPVPVA